MTCESDQFKSARAHIALCSDPIWSPTDDDDYIKTNKDLWLRICRIQERCEQERSCTCNGGFYSSETHSAQCRVWEKKPGKGTVQLPNYQTDVATCLEDLSDECVTNYRDDLTEPWMAPVEFYFQTLSKEEALDFSGRSSYSAMLRNFFDCPLQSFNNALTKDDRMWISTSNWYDIMKSFYPKLKIENDEETKMNGEKAICYNATKKLPEDQLEFFRYSIESEEEKLLEESINNEKIRRTWDSNAGKNPKIPNEFHHPQHARQYRSQHLNAEVPEFHPKVSGACTSSTTTITTARIGKQVVSTSSLLNLTENKPYLNASEHSSPHFASYTKDADYPAELLPYRVLANSRSERQLSSSGSAKYDYDSRETNKILSYPNSHSNRLHKYHNVGINLRSAHTPFFPKSMSNPREAKDFAFKYPVPTGKPNRSGKDQFTLSAAKKNRSALRKETQSWFADNEEDKIELLYPLDFDAHNTITHWIRTGYSTRANDFNYVSALMSDTSITPALKDDVENNSKTECESDTLPVVDTFPDLTTVKAPEIKLKQPNKKTTKKILDIQDCLEPKKRLYSAVLGNTSPEIECLLPLIDLSESGSNHTPAPSIGSDPDSDCTRSSHNKSETEEDFPQLTIEVSKKTESTGSMEKCYEELERQAIEQYKESEESLDTKYYQELERQAVEQYSASSQSNIENLAAASSVDSSVISTDTNTLQVCLSPSETALKSDVVNYIKLTKASPKQRKKGKKRKTKRSNLKNVNSPHTGADLKSHSVANKCANYTPKILNYFVIQYSYKCKTTNLRLLVHNEDLAKHMKTIVREFKSGVFCKQCRILPLMSPVEELYDGSDIHYFPIDDYRLTDVNYLPHSEDGSCLGLTFVFFEGYEVAVDIEADISNILFSNPSIRLMILGRSDLDSFKNSIPKISTEKRAMRHSASYDDSQTNRHFFQVGIKPMISCNIICHFLYYPVGHEPNDKANVKLMGQDRVRRIVNHIRTMWYNVGGGCYNYSLFYNGMPPFAPVKMWSPVKHCLPTRRIYRGNKDISKNRICDELFKNRKGMKPYFSLPKPKFSPPKTIDNFIDLFETRSIIDNEYIYTMLNLRNHFNGMEHSRIYAKSYEDEENNNVKIDMEFIKSVSEMLQRPERNENEDRLDHTSLFGSFVNSKHCNSTIYRTTPDVLERRWLFMWGFVAADLDICEPWHYDQDLKNKKYPIFYPKFVIRKPLQAIEPKPIEPKSPKPFNCIPAHAVKRPVCARAQYLNSAKNKKSYLQLSEQQKGDLKSMIALTLNKEIKSKDDVQKISFSMSKLIKDDIIEKLEKMSLNKKLNTEKRVIVESAEKIHRKIISSTFTEIVLEMCRGKKNKDSDLERKEQVFAAMIEHSKQECLLKNVARSARSAANKCNNPNRTIKDAPLEDEPPVAEDLDKIESASNIEMSSVPSNEEQIPFQNSPAESAEEDLKYNQENISSNENIPSQDNCRSRNRTWKKRDKNKSIMDCKAKPVPLAASNDIIHRITRYSPRPNRKNYTPPNASSNSSQIMLDEDVDEENIREYNEVDDKKADSSCGVM